MIRISTVYKKRIVELVTYKKDSGTILISRTYRFGHIDTDQVIEFPQDYSPDQGINVLQHFSPTDHALLDCCTEEIEFHNVHVDDKSEITSSELDLASAVEANGFLEFDNAWWFYGPLRFERVVE